MMQVTNFENASQFLETVGPLLEKDEARHSLILGRVRRLAENLDWVEIPTYLALIHTATKPVLAAMMTPPYGIVLALVGEEADTTNAVSALIAHLQAEKWQVPDLFGPSELARTFVKEWEAATGQTARLKMHERLHVLYQVEHIRMAPGRLRPAVAGDIELITKWGKAFQMEALNRLEVQQTGMMVKQRLNDFYLWEDSLPVCMLMRSRPTSRGITVTWVYTPPEWRGRGYATAAVATLSQQLLDEGYQFCTLYTDLANPTSNRIYYQVGYRPLDDFDKYVFLET